jgi:hypothetical protein
MEISQELKSQIHESIVMALAAYATDDDIDVQITDAVIEVFAAVAEPKVKVFGKTPVKYVGRRESYSDGNWNTGVWGKNQTKMITNAVAGLMLEHKDVYVQGEPDEGAEIVLQKEKQDDGPNSEKLMDAKQAVQCMTRKAAVQAFVAANYNGLKIPEEHSTLNEMKAFAIRQIDIYSLP